MQQLLHHIATNSKIDLSDPDYQGIDKIKYPNLNSAVLFCKAWLSDQKEFLINTSGSTGVPKLIELERELMKTSAKKTVQALQLPQKSNFLVCLNTEYIAGKMMLVRGLEHNMNLYVVEPSINPFDPIPQSIIIDFAALVPLQIESIIDQAGNALNILNNMKAVIVGGAPISHSLQLKIEKLNAPVYATYGMTETISHIALKKLNGNDKSDRYIVLEGIVVGQDERGCLTIKGDITHNELLVTNDLVDLIDRNQFVWLGRADNIINSGGVKVIPEIVEEKIASVFTQLDLDHQFFITSAPDEKLGQKVVLLIEGETFNTTFLNKMLQEALLKYQTPKEISFIKRFEYTSTDKLNRSATIANHLKSK